MKQIIFACAVAMALMISEASAQETTSLIVVTSEAEHTISAEVADTPELIEQGLMGRESLPEKTGMLFDLGEVRDINMWMKSTPLSLDMLFINAQGKILMIARNTVPESERRISAGTPVRAVLEISGGSAKTLGIAPGDVVQHEIFGNADLPD